MRIADVFVDDTRVGQLEEVEAKRKYRFEYHANYVGAPVSLTMPISTQVYAFDSFPAFFDGVLPEGVMLEALLKHNKIDRDDPFSQLLAVGEDLVGNVQVRGRL
jgi:serine/threonine-protein kinase HipA